MLPFIINFSHYEPTCARVSYYDTQFIENLLYLGGWLTDPFSAAVTSPKIVDATSSAHLFIRSTPQRSSETATKRIQCGPSTSAYESHRRCNGIKYFGQWSLVAARCRGRADMALRFPFFYRCFYCYCCVYRQQCPAAVLSGLCTAKSVRRQPAFRWFVCASCTPSQRVSSTYLHALPEAINPRRRIWASDVNGNSSVMHGVMRIDTLFEWRTRAIAVRTAINWQ